MKKLTITCTGVKIGFLGIGREPIKEVSTFYVTGSRLSVKKAEDNAVSNFMKKYNLGSAGVSSYL